MLDRNVVREQPDQVRWAMEVKGIDTADLDGLLEMDERWRELKAQGDDLRHERNEISERIGELKRDGEDEEAQQAIEQSQQLKSELESVEEEAADLEERISQEELLLPNIPSDEAPIGEDEDDNVELHRWGFDDLRDIPEEITPHYDLAEDLELIDFARGAKVAGGGFQFLKGDGARLEYALMRFMTDLHREEHGYMDVFPPIPVNSAAMRGTGQFPMFDVRDTFRLGGSNTEPYDDDDLWLLPTAEVPVTNMYADEILLDDDLPVKHVAFSPNFRREAGEHGTKTRGYVRVHQFNKVELVNFVRPADSQERHEELLAEAEEVLKRLGLPYRVIEICTGDMGAPHHRQYDIEVWAPADDMPDGPDIGGRWLEVSSASNFTEYQARRAGLRYRPERHESAEYLHTLNASGIALARTVVAIMEYYQNDDGTITIPEVLRPYMNGQEIIEGHDPIGESAVGAGRRD